MESKAAARAAFDLRYGRSDTRGDMAFGFDAGWNAAADVIRRKFFGGPTKDMILDWLGNPEPPGLRDGEADE